MPKYGFDIYRFDQARFDEQTIFHDQITLVAVEDAYKKIISKLEAEEIDITDEVLNAVYKVLEEIVTLAEQHNFSVAKVFEDDGTVVEVIAKHIRRMAPEESLQVTDSYILTASPNVRERPRIVEEIARQVFAKRKTEAAIHEEFEIKKALLPAYGFVGVDGVRVRHNNLTISDSINDRVSTCSFEVIDPSQNVVDACYFRSPIRVLLIDGETIHYFGGRIRNVTLISESPIRTIQVEAEDYTAEAADFSVVGEYSGNVRDVVQSMWNEFYERPFVFAMEETDETIGVRFNYEQLDKATEYIIEQLGWTWYVDFDGAQRIFRAFPPEFKVYPETLSQQNRNVMARSPQFAPNDDIANAIYLFGGQGISELVNQQIVADGENNIYTLAYKPVDLEITMDGQPLSVGVENLHDYEEGFDVLMNYNEKTIAWEKESEPPQGAVIDAQYKYRYPVVVYMEDKESIAAYGKTVKRINDAKVTDPIQARRVVEKELERRAQPQVEGSLETTALGIRAGMYIPVDLPMYNAVGIFRVDESEKYIEGSMIMNRLSLNRVSGSIKKLANKIKELSKRLENLEAQQRDDVVVQRFSTIGEELTFSDSVEITPERAGVIQFGAARWNFGNWA